MKRLAMAAVLLVAAAVWLYVSRSAATTADFSLTDLHGRPMQQSRHSQGCALIYFWYPSCPACAEQLPAVREIYQQTRKNPQPVRVMAVALPYDDEATARRYAAAHHMDFQVAIDVSGHVAKQYGVSVAPMIFLVNPQQTILKTYVGVIDAATLARAVAQCRA